MRLDYLFLAVEMCVCCAWGVKHAVFYAVAIQPGVFGGKGGFRVVGTINNTSMGIVLVLVLRCV